MKNKIGTKVLSALLAFVLMLLPLSGSVFTQEAKAATKTLQEVQAMFPHGKYRNHVAKKVTAMSAIITTQGCAAISKTP